MIQIDMEMPEGCTDCNFYSWELDSDNPSHCVITGDYVYCGGTARPSWCPLQEVEDDTDDRR